jgi:arsenite transporter
LIARFLVNPAERNHPVRRILLFGFNSGAALATVVGVLVEVPVMLSVVRITTAIKGWYERGLSAAHRGAPAHPRR